MTSRGPPVNNDSCDPDAAGGTDGVSYPPAHQRTEPSAEGSAAIAAGPFLEPDWRTGRALLSAAPPVAAGRTSCITPHVGDGSHPSERMVCAMPRLSSPPCLTLSLALVASGFVLPVEAQDCLPCHYCPWNQEWRQVRDEGSSTLYSPREFESTGFLDCWVGDCPGIEQCQEQDMSEPELLLLASALGWAGPQAAEEGSRFTIGPADGLMPLNRGPRLVRTRCGLEIYGIPRFADLVPEPKP